jgi:hypothetical protein
MLYYTKKDHILVTKLVTETNTGLVTFPVQRMLQNIEPWPCRKCNAIPFVVFQVFRELRDHTSNYYFCSPNVSKHKFSYFL